MLGNALARITIAAAFAAFVVHSANAQATRTWVSGIGNDADPCSRTAPCKTFAGAISKTAAGGEINALDPGGFGAVTITKSITIDGGGGQVASVLVAGTNGIVINAGANDVVTLRNLRINGVLGSPSPGLNGVRFLAGAALHIENSAIFGFSQNGVNISLSSSAASRVFVTDTVVSHSTGGIAARTTGSGNVFVALHRVTLTQNSSFGFKADGGGGPGIIVNTVSDSLISGNGTGILGVSGATAVIGIRVTRSSIVNNVTNGLRSDGSAGQTVAMVSSNNLISGNGTGLSAAGAGLLLTLQNNTVNGNFTEGAFTNTLGSQ